MGNFRSIDNSLIQRLAHYLRKDRSEASSGTNSGRRIPTQSYKAHCLIRQRCASFLLSAFLVLPSSSSSSSFFPQSPLHLAFILLISCPYIQTLLSSHGVPLVPTARPITQALARFYDPAHSRDPALIRSSSDESSAVAACYRSCSPPRPYPSAPFRLLRFDYPPAAIGGCHPRVCCISAASFRCLCKVCKCPAHSSSTI